MGSCCHCQRLGPGGASQREHGEEPWQSLLRSLLAGVAKENQKERVGEGRQMDVRLRLLYLVYETRSQRLICARAPLDRLGCLAGHLHCVNLLSVTSFLSYFIALHLVLHATKA